MSAVVCFQLISSANRYSARVRRSFRLEAKRCEKGSEKNFASKRNKGLVSLVSLLSETAIFACETKWLQSEK
jgi:hypothetical protein